MDSLWEAFLVGLGFFIGCVFGKAGEAASWRLSARSKWRTAHRSKGNFYYVIPEDEFVNEWNQKNMEL